MGRIGDYIAKSMGRERGKSSKRQERTDTTPTTAKSQPRTDATGIKWRHKNFADQSPRNFEQVQDNGFAAQSSYTRSRTTDESTNGGDEEQHCSMNIPVLSNSPRMESGAAELATKENEPAELPGDHIHSRRSIHSQRLSSPPVGEDSQLQLQAVLGMILQASDRFAALSKVPTDSAQRATGYVLEAYENLDRAYATLHRINHDMEAVLKGRETGVINEIKCLRHQLAGYENSRLKLLSERDSYETEWNKTTKEKRRLEEKHNEEVESLSGKLAKAKKERDEIRIRFNAELEKAQSTNRYEISKLESLHADRLRVLNDEMEKTRSSNLQEISKLESRHAEKLRMLNDEKNAINQHQANKHVKVVADMRAEFQDERETLRNTIQVTKHTYEQSMEEEAVKHKSQLRQLQEQVEKVEQSVEKERAKMRAESEDIRNDNEKLKGALVKREHIRGLTDPELGARFKKLAGDVEDFSRLTWDDEKEASWPFDEHVLMRISPENPRRLKQQIVQNTLWHILFDKIFSTPFKVVGKQGKHLDSEWLEEFGAGYFSSVSEKWPNATMESEKKRCETAKTLLEAIQTNAATDKARHEQNVEYEESITAIADEIVAAIARVSTVEAYDRKALLDLIRYCGRLWLEVCAQRYRTTLIFPIDTESVLKSSRKNWKVLKLVAKPEIRRRGNAQGLELFKEEVISGWKGVHFEYSVKV